MDSYSEYAIPAIIVLVGLTSFGLGRLSVEVGELPATGLTASTFAIPDVPRETAGAEPQAVALSTGEVVASVSGTKYHYPWCSGAQRIKEENKVWFESTEAARAAGYEPAANCKGLK